MSYLEEFVKNILRRNGVDYLPKLVKEDFLGNTYSVRNGVIDDGDYVRWSNETGHKRRHSGIGYKIPMEFEKELKTKQIRRKKVRKMPCLT